jgi:tetratricopeptide (TPR) repeat protein
MVVALRIAGRTEESLEEADKILAAHPENVPARVQRGILLYLSGKKESARRAWEDALYREPTDKLVQLYLNTLDRETTGK